MGLTYLGPNTVIPASKQEARARVLNLYREWLREVPRSLSMYRLETSVPNARSIVRSWFEQNRQVSTLEAIHQLTVKSTMELIEMHNRWKQRPHVSMLFGQTRVYPNEKERLLKDHPNMSSFLASFLANPNK